MNILEAFEKSNKIDNRPRDITLEVGECGLLSVHYDRGLKINDIRSNDWLPIIEPLTFEKIKAECVAGESLLVDVRGGYRIYLGFNRYGHLVTDMRGTPNILTWSEPQIENWKISDEKWGWE